MIQVIKLNNNNININLLMIFIILDEDTTSIFSKSPKTHYLSTLNDLLAHYKGIMRRSLHYDKIIKMMNHLFEDLITNGKEIFESLSNVSDSNKNALQNLAYIKELSRLFENVYINPPQMIDNFANYFNISESSKFNLNCDSFVTIFDNLKCNMNFFRYGYEEMNSNKERENIKESTLFKENKGSEKEKLNGDKGKIANSFTNSLIVYFRLLMAQFTFKKLEMEQDLEKQEELIDKKNELRVINEETGELPPTHRYNIDIDRRDEKQKLSLDAFILLFDDIRRINESLIKLVEICEILQKEGNRVIFALLNKFVLFYFEFIYEFLIKVLKENLFEDKLKFFILKQDVVEKELFSIFHKIKTDMNSVFEGGELKPSMFKFFEFLSGIFKENYYLQTGFKKDAKTIKQSIKYFNLIHKFTDGYEKQESAREEKDEEKRDANMLTTMTNMSTEPNVEFKTNNPNKNEDDDDLKPTIFHKIFFQEIEKLGNQETSLLNLINIVCFWYGDNRAIEDILTEQTSENNQKDPFGKNFKEMVDNCDNPKNQFLINFHDLLTFSASNNSIFFITSILNSLLKCDEYKSVYQRIFASYMKKLTDLQQNHNNEIDNKFFYINFNMVFFSCVLINMNYFFNQIDNPNIDKNIICETISFPLKVIQYSCEFQNQFFKSLIYKTLLYIRINKAGKNEDIYLSLNDILIFNLFSLGKVYLLFYDYILNTGSRAENPTITEDNLQPENVSQINTLQLQKCTPIVLALYQYNFDTLIEIIQGSPSNLIDRFVKLYEINVEEDDNKKPKARYSLNEEKIEVKARVIEAHYKINNIELFKSFLAMQKEILFKSKYNKFSLSDLRNIDFKFMKKNFFLFLNSILEQNFMQKKIISSIQSIINTEDVLGDIHFQTFGIIDFYNRKSSKEKVLQKYNFVETMKKLESGEFIKDFKVNMARHSQPENKINIKLAIKNRIKDTNIVNDNNKEIENIVQDFIYMIKIMFLYVKLMSDLYEDRIGLTIKSSSFDDIVDGPSTIAIEPEHENTKLKARRKSTYFEEDSDLNKNPNLHLTPVLNWYYDSVYVNIDIRNSSKDNIMVFFPVPDECSLITDSTKAHILDSIDRTTALSKINTFINKTTFEILSVETTYFNSTEKRKEFVMYKFINDLNMWNFEIVNFVLSLIINLLLLVSLDNTQLESGNPEYNWMIRFMSFIQILYIMTYLGVWISYKYITAIRLELNYYECLVKADSEKKRNEWWDKFNIVWLDHLFLNSEFNTFLFTLILNLIAVSNTKLFFFYGFQLLTILNLSKTLKSINSAIVAKSKPLLLAAVFLFVVVYSFTIIGFYFLDEEFSETIEVNNNINLNFNYF